MPAKCKRTVMIAYLLERMYCLYIRILASVYSGVNWNIPLTRICSYIYIYYCKYYVY